MAEIPVSSRIATVLPADKHAKDRQRKRDQASKEQEAFGPAQSAADGDVFTVMDIPADEITPKVQETLNQLMAQFDKLRDELDHARSHILYLEELSEAHTYLPVINRRGLHRELSRMLFLGERAGIVNTFVCFHVRNIEDIRRRYGHGAAEAGLTWVANSLNASSRDSDIVGSLGGHDFGVILTLADSDSASDKAMAMAHALEDKTFSWEGENLSLKTVYGLRTFQPGDSAESVMLGADDDLLMREREIENRRGA